MEFDLESKLMRVLENEARSRAESPFAKCGAELLVFPQVSVGQIIPDLVIIRRLLRTSAVTRTVKLTNFESWIVGELLRTGELAEPSLTRSLYTRTEATQVALAKLEKVGMVRRTESGTYIATDFAVRFEVVSVEAKLSRWKMAINQAKSYLRFSDESYIALPASVTVKNPQIKARCSESGVGLIAVSRREISVVLSPKRTAEPDRREWTWLLAKTGAIQI
jgi:hypothetical protein